MQRKEISFKGQKVFIGIDVHKDSWRVAIAPEVGVVKGHSQKPSARELLDFLKKYYPDGEYHAVYESGFSGFSTYYALQDVGIDCIVIHAADVPTTQYEETMKTDKAAQKNHTEATRKLQVQSKASVAQQWRDFSGTVLDTGESLVKSFHQMAKGGGGPSICDPHLARSADSSGGGHPEDIAYGDKKCQGTEPKRTLQTRLRVADIHSRSRGQCGDDTFD